MTLGVALASAADLSVRKTMPYKAQPYTQTYNWSGFYLGVNGGGGWGDSGSSGNFKGLVGGTVGYNYQVSQAVFGRYRLERSQSQRELWRLQLRDSEQLVEHGARTGGLCVRSLHALRHRGRRIR